MTTPTTLQLLEEKLLSLASGSDDKVKDDDDRALVGDVQKGKSWRSRCNLGQ
jgi:hypothetical protein